MVNRAFILGLVVASPIVWAQPGDSRKEAVQSARANALANLQHQINEVQLSSDLTVGQLIQKIGGEQILLRTLDDAQQIGGPRWIDEQICQVQLDISGMRVGQAIVQIVKNAPANSPMTDAQVQAEVSSWRSRTFSAVGSSLNSKPGSPLDNAIKGARADAVDRVVKSLGKIRLQDGRTAEAALGEQGKGRINSWLSNRPVASLESTQDGRLVMTLSVQPTEFTEEFKRWANPPAANGWGGDLQKSFTELPPATGEMRVGNAGAGNDLFRMTEPPFWTNDSLTSEGFSTKLESKLRTARAAEADAAKQLKTKVLALKVNPKLSLDQASQKDAEISKAIDRALLRARVLKTDYHSDGSVTVETSLSLEELWSILSKPNR